MARLEGFEPPTHCLEGSCSILLSYNRVYFVERVMGIEPTQPAWKAGILPLNYTRIFSAAVRGNGDNYTKTQKICQAFSRFMQHQKQGNFPVPTNRS